MKKVVVSKQRKSRELVSNPHSNETLKKRQKKSGCISHGKNSSIKDLGNGYSQIVFQKDKKS